VWKENPLPNSLSLICNLQWHFLHKTFKLLASLLYGFLSMWWISRLVSGKNILQIWQ
jgi:hypothetical protein